MTKRIKGLAIIAIAVTCAVIAMSVIGNQNKPTAGEKANRSSEYYDQVPARISPVDPSTGETTEETTEPVSGQHVESNISLYDVLAHPKSLSSSQISTLGRMLEDPTRLPIWTQILAMLAYNRDVTAVPILEKMIVVSPMDPDLDFDQALAHSTVKLVAIRGLGIIGGGEAGMLLRKLVTEKGAVEASKNWLDAAAQGQGEDSRLMIARIRGEAAKGLALTGITANRELISAIYDRSKKRTDAPELFGGSQPSDNEFHGFLVDAMALSKYLEHHGLQATLEMLESEYLDEEYRRYLYDYGDLDAFIEKLNSLAAEE